MSHSSQHGLMRVPRPRATSLSGAAAIDRVERTCQISLGLVLNKGTNPPWEEEGEELLEEKNGEAMLEDEGGD